MAWQQLHFECKKDSVLALEARLFEAGAVSVLLEDAGDEPLLEPPLGTSPLWSDVVVTAIFDTHTADALTGVDFEAQALALGSEAGAGRIWLDVLEDTDWTQAWQAHYTPIQIADGLWIVPKWLKAVDADAVNVYLDPGLAFGTGYHATTRLCLAYLATLDLSGKTVIDYGAGSGILAICALKLGAKKAYAVDIDPQAVLSATQNATLNDVSERLWSMNVEEFDMLNVTADVVCANILAHPLIALAPRLQGLLKPKGDIVMSGLLTHQADEVLAAYTGLDMDPPFIFDVAEDAHWCRLSGKNRP